MSELRRQLARLPGRCTACGGHLATQGHGAHCPLGPRAIVTLDGAGRPILRPTPPPVDRRYGPAGTTTPAGSLPTTCRQCGAYPSRTGSGHNARCPNEGIVTYAV